MKAELVAISILAAVVLISNLFMGLGVSTGKEVQKIEILQLCQERQKVTINNVDVHCGVISKKVNLAEARYQQVQTCLATINRWTLEHSKR
jgi:hypothetical protein